ncbi:MAG: ATP-dependent DNA helicase RecG [bacterium]
MTLRRLATPLTDLRGVGAIVGGHLEKIGLVTVHDLLHYFPRRYDDFSQLKPINQLRPGLVSVRARVDLIKVRSSFKRKRMVLTEAIVSDETGSLKLTWFNTPWVIDQLQEGQEYYFLGDLRYVAHTFGISQPSYEAVDSMKLAGNIVPIYSETADVSSRLVRSLIEQVLESCELLEDTLPPYVRADHSLVSFATAVRQLHVPKVMTEIDVAKRRMAFGELFFRMSAGLAIKAELQTEPAQQIPFDESLAKQFVAKLPFSLTPGQKQAAWKIFHDLDLDHPMNRLLEGDVGSGKTVVAAFAALMAIRAGYQVAIMVPTDILARQHRVTLQELLEPWQIRTELLVSKLPAKNKADVRSRLQSGEIDLVIGTQALLTSTTEFANIGLVIVDEQHRFGVAQRLSLKDKAGRLPHVLTMTATPIPRSLALIIYGDLDISILKDMPAGRLPIKTKVVFDDDRTTVYGAVDTMIAQGHQAYFVCPAIDETDSGGVKAAKKEFENLQSTVFKHRRIGLVHGKLKPDEKASVMQNFIDGELDILVATTVIEVGVHVDRANVMVIEQAERFGLASLHQLRGRVGRGSEQAFCWLFSSRKDEAALARVRAIEKTNDGFRLAQIDLESRGPGQRIGTKQSGLSDLQFAKLDDTELIAEVREAAQAFLTDKNIVQYPLTTQEINRLKIITSLD